MTAEAMVIGVGNVLLRDDGAGVRAMEALREVAERDPAALPAGTRLVDGGTLGLGLLGTFEGARSLLLLDAMDLSLPPGTVRVLRGDEIAAGGGREGAANGGVGELLAMAGLIGLLPDSVTMIGIQVADLGFGVGLSDQVRAAVPLAVEAARRELADLDHDQTWPDAPEGAMA